MSLILSAARENVFFLPNAIAAFATSGTATAELSLERNGDIQGTDVGEWYKRGLSTVGDDFEAFASEVGGPAGFSGTLDSWVQISETRTWSISQTGPGSKSGTLQITLRRIGDTTNVINETILFDAEVAP